MQITLRTRLLLFTFGIVVALVGLSLAVIHRSVERQIRSQLTVDLRTTGTVFGTIMEDRAVMLRQQSLVVAEDPRFSATLDIPDPDLQTHIRTVIPVAKQFQSIISSDLFIVTNGDGRVLARLELSDIASSETNVVVEETSLREGSSSQEESSSSQSAQQWRVEGNSYAVVTVPVASDADIIGTLSVGFAGDVDTDGLEEHLRAIAASREAVSAVESNRNAVADDLIRELRRSLTPDLIAISGGGSPRVERYRVSSGEDFSSHEPVVDALNGRNVTGFFVEAERLYHLVAVPVFSRDEIIGTLSAGFMIDDGLATNLADMMDSHVSFVHDGRVVASTWDESQREELQSWAEGGLQSGEPVEMVIAGETYLSLAGEFTPARVDEVDDADRVTERGGFYIIQLSIDRAFEFLDELESLLLLIGLAVLVVGGLLSFVGSRRITRPILALVDGTERLAAGDLQHQLDVKTRSELGQLARSFNDMVSAISQSRQALEESERAYRDLFDNAQDLVFTTDLDMQITSVNKAGLQSLGYAADEVVGRSIYSLLSPADAGRVRQQEELASPGNRRPGFEASFVRGDGSEAAFEIVSRWIVESGATTGVHAEEIVSNLIFNAVDAMPSGGTIEIVTRHVNGEVVLTVSDDGSGMDEETRRRIFEPFFTTKGADQGTGLGLSTVWGLAQTMGARVSVDSLPGKGTTFTIRVAVADETPADTESAAVGGAGNGARARPESLNILIVDDEPRVLELLPPLLEPHYVETANRSAEGLERVRHGGYDIVISDWIMAEVSGLELASEVKATSPRRWSF